MGLLSDGPITFVIQTHGPMCQQDYPLARLFTKRILLDWLVSGPTFFFFFWCSDEHFVSTGFHLWLGWDTWRKCLYALAAVQCGVGLLHLDKTYLVSCLGRHVAIIPTKTPFSVDQFGGRSSSSFSQLDQVALTSFSSRTLFPNLPLFVNAWSIVSLLLIPWVHLL